MSNSLKQVYASLYIDENELQLLVAEYYNTRFNIIRVDKVKMEGILNFKVTDSEKVSKIIKDTIKNASKKIGAQIKKVILVLPAQNYKRIPLGVSVTPTTGAVSKKDVARALSSALRTGVDDDLIIVNATVVKYVVNGLSTRRLPENEACKEMLMDVDLLCADKEMIFDYINACTNAGVEILDITLNNYAICKEAVLLEQSLQENIILLDISNRHTYLSLLSKGKLITTEVIRDGMDVIASSIAKSLSLPLDAVPRLMKYNVDYSCKYPDDAIFAWSDEDKDTSNSITVSQLNEACKKPLNDYIDKIIAMCKPILETGKTSFFIVGEGSKMNALSTLLKEKSEVDVRQYYPDTIGIRDSALCSCYGAFFVYREKALLNEVNVSCVDIAEYDTTVDQRKIDVEGESITTKIKKLFEQYRDREDI